MTDNLNVSKKQSTGPNLTLYIENMVEVHKICLH